MLIHILMLIHRLILVLVGIRVVVVVIVIVILIVGLIPEKGEGKEDNSFVEARMKKMKDGYSFTMCSSSTIRRT
jgi:hypothetical protein